MLTSVKELEKKKQGDFFKFNPATSTADLQKILLQFNNLGRLRYQNETTNCFFFYAKKLLITFQFVLK